MIPVRTSYFGPVLMQTKVDQTRLDKLKEYGTIARNNKQSFNHKLAGHLKSQFYFDEQSSLWFYDNFKQEFDAYSNLFDAHFKQRSIKQFEPVGLWINYMRSGDFNPAHIHGADLSFVIFVEVPDELKKEADAHEGDSPDPGSISFIYGEDSDWVVSSHAHFPATGDMFIFPAKLRHFVMPFKSDIERVTVSGNLRMINDNIQKN